MSKHKAAKKFLVFILVLVFSMGSFVLPALAEGEQMTMRNLSVSVWPEYNSNLIEVGYYGTFVNDTGKPFQGEIRYNVPKGATISMVCETEQGMLCQPYKILNAGDYEQVVWRPSHEIAPGAEFPVMIEYEYNPVGKNPQREFDFQFSADFNVESMNVAVKQPFRSNDFKILPEAEMRSQDGEGFNSYEYNYETYEPGETLSYTVSYVKNDNDPSVNPEEQQPAADGGVQASTPMNSSTAVIIVAFLVILAVIVYVAMNKNNNNTRKKPAKKNNKSGQKPVQSKKKKQSSGGEAQSNSQADERRKLRKMLMDGKISEQTYQQLIAEIDEES